MDDETWVRRVNETAEIIDRLGVGLGVGLNKTQDALSAAGVGRSREITAAAVRARRGQRVVRPANSRAAERKRWTLQRDRARDNKAHARAKVAELEASDDWPAEVTACREALRSLDLPNWVSLSEAQHALKEHRPDEFRGAVSEAAWGIHLGIEPIRPEYDVAARERKLAHARASVDLWTARAEKYDQRLNDCLAPSDPLT